MVEDVATITKRKDGAFYINYVCQAVDMDEDVATITKAVEGLVVCTDFSLEMMGVYFAEVKFFIYSAKMK